MQEDLQNGCTPLPGRRRSVSEHHSAHLSFCPSTRPRGTVAWLCLGRESTCSARKQSRLSSVATSSLPAGPRTASSAGKLNAVGVSFFNMHEMISQAFRVCQIPRPDCLEGIPLTNLDQRLKALRDASQSSSSCRWTKHQPGRLPPSRTAVLLRKC